MAKPKKNTLKPNKSGKKRVRKGIGLKRYNKILSITLKDLKKRGVEYDINEVRKEVSAIYPSFKDVAPSRIGKKDVINKIESNKEPKEDTILINATEIPRSWFDTETEWYELEKLIIDFNDTYPEIPIVLKSAENELRIEGVIGEYSGSILADFVNEKLRDEFGNESGYFFFGIPAWQDRKNKTYAFFGTDDADLPPNIITDFKPIEPKKQKEIDKREDELKQKKSDKKKQDKKKLPKGEKKKPAPAPKKEEPKQEVKKGLSDIQSSNLTKQLELLREDFKDGVYTKDEYKLKRDELINKYSKGGLL
jgi:hypothetical protein